MSGPLTGVRLIELTAIGPVPFAGALLADLGANVLRIDRPPGMGLAPDKPPQLDFYNRNKRSFALALKRPAAVQAVLGLVARAEVLLEKAIARAWPSAWAWARTPAWPPTCGWSTAA